VSKASGGGGGGNGAYNVTLVNASDTNSPASAVECANWPTNRTCIVDGGQLSTVNVTMGTDPIADGATVSWAVNDTTIATVDPNAGATQGNGQNSTDVALNQNGDVVVYVSSGAGGNRTTLRVTGLNVFSYPFVAYSTGGSDVRAVNPAGSTKEFLSSENNGVSAFGPSVNLGEGNPDVEALFVNGSGYLVAVDRDGTRTGLSPRDSLKRTVGIGDPDSDGKTTFIYADGNGDLWTKEYGGTEQAVVNTKGDGNPSNDQQVKNVLGGVGYFDIDGDSTEELVYLRKSDGFGYVDGDGSTTKVSLDISIGQGNGYAIGDSADFGSGVRVPVVTTNQNIVVLAPDGTSTVVYDGTSPTPAVGHVAVVDWDADGQDEIVFADDNNAKLYVIDKQGGTWGSPQPVGASGTGAVGAG
jgi:hypothetical protein